jgi:hypothetical protein
MFGFVRKSLLIDLEDQLNVVAADRDHLYEMVDYEQERAISLIKQREEAYDAASFLDEGLNQTKTRLSLINFLAHPGTSYFVVAVNGEDIISGAEIKEPIDGMDIAVGIEELLDRSAQEIADAYGLDLDEIREELEAEEMVG